MKHFKGRALPPGPWDTEPDHEEFRSPEGFPCILHRGYLGAWCGYVGVPPGHRWHGGYYLDIDTKVHGGLTYSSKCRGDICHTPQPGESDDVWWVGFDCNHCTDLAFEDICDPVAPWHKEYRTIDYVRDETLLLAAHAARVS